MPRPAKGPRLYLRKDENKWVIRDAGRTIRTGCAGPDTGEAEQRLARYIAEKHDPKGSSRPAEVLIADVLNLYSRNKGPSLARPKELVYHVRHLRNFWKARTVSEIRGETCRSYAKRRSTTAMARRELEVLRAAVKHYHEEYGLDAVPVVTMPPKSEPRDRWLTRQEVARLLWACRKTGNKHVARVILIGLYTGTRCGAILSLQWHPNTTGGWIDFDSGVMYRRALRERETKKRKPPVKLPRRLMAHLERWKKIDKGIRHVVHYKGEPIKKVKRAWGSVRDEAKLDKSVVVHTLRHTAATWLMQRGVDIWEASSFLGMKPQTMESTYAHHHPDYQKNAAEAL